MPDAAFKMQSEEYMKRNTPTARRDSDFCGLEFRISERIGEATRRGNVICITQGVVIIDTVYNPTDPATTDVRGFVNYYRGTLCAVTEYFVVQGRRN